MQTPCISPSQLFKFYFILYFFCKCFHWFLDLLKLFLYIATYSADCFRQFCLPSDSQLFFHIIITKNEIYGDDSTIIANWHYDRFLPLVVLSEMTLTYDFQAECHILIYTFFFAAKYALLREN